MSYSINLLRDWAATSVRVYKKGPYRVPEDMSQELAKQALTRRLATKTMPPRETKKSATEKS